MNTTSLAFSALALGTSLVAQSPLHLLCGVADDRYGSAVAERGDIDGDGVPIVAVAITSRSNEVADAGSRPTSADAWPFPAWLAGRTCCTGIAVCGGSVASAVPAADRRQRIAHRAARR